MENIKAIFLSTIIELNSVKSSTLDTDFIIILHS